MLINFAALTNKPVIFVVYDTEDFFLADILGGLCWLKLLQATWTETGDSGWGFSNHMEDVIFMTQGEATNTQLHLKHLLALCHSGALCQTNHMWPVMHITYLISALKEYIYFPLLQLTCYIFFLKCCCAISSNLV